MNKLSIVVAHSDDDQELGYLRRIEFELTAGLLVEIQKARKYLAGTDIPTTVSIHIKSIVTLVDNECGIEDLNDEEILYITNNTVKWEPEKWVARDVNLVINPDGYFQIEAWVDTDFEDPDGNIEQFFFCSETFNFDALNSEFRTELFPPFIKE